MTEAVFYDFTISNHLFLCLLGNIHDVFYTWSDNCRLQKCLPLHISGNASGFLFPPLVEADNAVQLCLFASRKAKFCAVDVSVCAAMEATCLQRRTVETSLGMSPER